MSDIHITRITDYNEDQIHDLFSEIGEAASFYNPQFFEDNKNIFLLAETNSVACGFLYAYLLPSPKSSNSKIFLYSIDVFEKYRRTGVASKLIENLKVIAKENNCKGVFVLTKLNNVAAMQLYQKTGGIREKDDVMFVYQLND